VPSVLIRQPLHCTHNQGFKLALVHLHGKPFAPLPVSRQEVMNSLLDTAEVLGDRDSASTFSGAGWPV